ncbi:hypothetical protein AVEN_220595-1 [Araneus ventricosus]|uniref:LRRCT domain-containing protein n=1 Tax=Araneus ventricosus TaxID=182803 RepID=A0A4Y2TGN5_ARAVE|nr:hypothetical protein AVEN_220595-1 [Araneus ventricosus]
MTTSGNPFKCDCQLLPFLQYLNSSSVGTDGPLCTPSNQTSLLPPAKCPDGCHCFCTQNKDKHFMSVDCSFAGLTELPRLFTTECSSTAKENCSSMTIHLPRDTQFFQSGPFAIEDEIGGVNLSHNHLQSLERNHLRGGIRHLFLDNNHLRKPPLSLLYSLENLNNVTLSGNPWSCECDLLSFKEWILYKSEIVADANETRCGSEPSGLNGRVIWSLTDMDLCPVSIGSSTSLVIGLLYWTVQIGLCSADGRLGCADSRLGCADGRLGCADGRLGCADGRLGCAYGICAVPAKRSGHQIILFPADMKNMCVLQSWPREEVGILPRYGRARGTPGSDIYSRFVKVYDPCVMPQQMVLVVWFLLGGCCGSPCVDDPLDESEDVAVCAWGDLLP